MAATELFRQVELPAGVPGRLYLHSMPGAFEALALSVTEIGRLSVSEVVCLAPPDELSDLAPAYRDLLRRGVTWHHTSEPVEDFGIVGSDQTFRCLAREVASFLREGKNVLVHCGAGIGRSGTLAVAVLCSLGVSLNDSLERVERTGSHPENEQQGALLRRLFS